MLKICKIIFCSTLVLTALLLVIGYILEQKDLVDRELAAHYAKVIAFSLGAVLAFSGLPLSVTQFFQFAAQLNIAPLTQLEIYSNQIIYSVWAIWAVGVGVMVWVGK